MTIIGNIVLVLLLIFMVSEFIYYQRLDKEQEKRQKKEDDKWEEDQLEALKQYLEALEDQRKVIYEGVKAQRETNLLLKAVLTPVESTDEIKEDKGVPLDQYIPDFSKPVKLVFKQTADGHGLEEVEDNG